MEEEDTNEMKLLGFTKRLGSKKMVAAAVTQFVGWMDFIRLCITKFETGRRRLVLGFEVGNR
jgi:hypothetical protein